MFILENDMKNELFKAVSLELQIASPIQEIQNKRKASLQIFNNNA